MQQVGHQLLQLPCAELDDVHQVALAEAVMLRLLALLLQHACLPLCRCNRWGINFYSRPVLNWTMRTTCKPGERMTDMFYPIYPQGLYNAIARCGWWCERSVVVDDSEVGI